MKYLWFVICWIKYDSIFLVDSNFFFDLFFLDFLNEKFLKMNLIKKLCGKKRGRRFFKIDLEVKLE